MAWRQSRYRRVRGYALRLGHDLLPPSRWNHPSDEIACVIRLLTA
jgi:hypothetical protein